MLFKFEEALPSLELGKTYVGVITSVNPDTKTENTEKERVFVNVEVEGFTGINPAVYYTTKGTGGANLKKLLTEIGATPSKDDEGLKNITFPSCKGKKVRVWLSENGDFVNTQVGSLKSSTAVSDDEAAF